MLIGYPEGKGTHEIKEAIIHVDRNFATNVRIEMKLAPDPAEEARSQSRTEPIRAIAVHFSLPDGSDPDLFFDLQGLDREAFKMMLDGKGHPPTSF